VIIAGVFNPEDAKTYGDVLDVDRLIDGIAAAGKPAMTLSDADAIVEHLAPELAAGDVVAIMSNGGFGGIHEKVLEALRS
jgi:UDP-N-acetylmuramate: L-alanyl-gamma-D-glutamyl-meso-diaminopimelate ligase